MSNDHTIEDIPANELVTMTEAMHRLFTVGGCDPTCHGCDKTLKVGAPFKLAEVTKDDIKEANEKMGPYYLKSQKPHEVMLCEKCTPRGMIAVAYRNRTRRTNKFTRNSPRALGAGCFRINGKIVP